MNSMILVSMLGMALMSLPGVAWSGELILNEARLNALEKQARENPYRKRRSLCPDSLLPYELGRVVTPFFQDPVKDVAKRRYRAEKKCFEVSYLPGLNQVARIRCEDLHSDLRIEGFPEFRSVRVADLAAGGKAGFPLPESEAVFRLRGYLHDEETVRMDQRVLNLPDLSAFPSANFEVGMKENGRVTMDASAGIRIEQLVERTIGKLGIVSARKDSYRSSFGRGPEDRVFSDGKGKVILLNDLMLPSALRNHLVGIRSEWKVRMGALETRSQSGPICFRDSGYGSATLDCHQMVLQERPVDFRNFKGLLLDFTSGSLSTF
jgi:hypothetical protein